MGSLFALTLATVTSMLPLFQGNTWLGTAPTQTAVTGKVTIVDFFTFSCINCKHVVPELRSLRDHYPRSRVAIVGIHTPETSYERDRTNVVRNLAYQDITWPVALDNDYALWNTYNIKYWPTQLIFDRKGQLRQTVIGEGQDSLVEATVRSLLAER